MKDKIVVNEVTCSILGKDKTGPNKFGADD